MYDPKKRPEILDILTECMQRVADEAPAVYKEVCLNIIKMLQKCNKSGIWPETFFVMSNRVGGKTYSVSKMILYAAMSYGVKFGLHCRTMGQLGKFANGVMHRVLEDAFPEWTMSEKVVSKFYSEIWMSRVGEDEVKERVLVGYVLPLNSDSRLKDVSSILSDIEVMFMDEFQSSDSVPEETDKFVNIHHTVARGVSRDGVNYGVRYLPTFMCSNSLSVTNKYLALFDIMGKIQSNTKLYRGPGVSLLRFKNESVAENQRTTAFNMSVGSRSDVVASNIDNAWLNDNNACVEKPNGWGQSYYICTIISGKDKYGVSYYGDMGYYYVSRSIDKTGTVYNITPGGVANVPLLRSAIVFGNLREHYGRGLCRFSDQGVKGVMDIIFKV